MKYRLGTLTIEAIDTYVRVSVLGAKEAGGYGAPDTRYLVSEKECPTTREVIELVMEIRKSSHWPDSAVLAACSSAAEDARNNKADKELAL